MLGPDRARIIDEPVNISMTPRGCKDCLDASTCFRLILSTLDVEKSIVRYRCRNQVRFQIIPVVSRHKDL